MSKDLTICDISPELAPLLRKFRFRKEKNSAAIIMKIDPQEHMVVLEETLEDIDITELAAALPDSFPRYVVYTFEHRHKDGRVSYPLFFIFVSPTGTKPELQMMYAGTKLALLKAIDINKIFEVRSTDDLDEAWLEEKMAFFK